MPSQTPAERSTVHIQWRPALIPALHVGLNGLDWGVEPARADMILHVHHNLDDQGYFFFPRATGCGAVPISGGAMVRAIRPRILVPNSQRRWVLRTGWNKAIAVVGSIPRIGAAGVLHIARGGPRRCRPQVRNSGHTVVPSTTVMLSQPPQGTGEAPQPDSRTPTRQVAYRWDPHELFSPRSQCCPWRHEHRRWLRPANTPALRSICSQRLADHSDRTAEHHATWAKPAMGFFPPSLSLSSCVANLGLLMAGWGYGYIQLGVGLRRLDPAAKPGFLLRARDSCGVRCFAAWWGRRTWPRYPTQRWWRRVCRLGQKGWKWSWAEGGLRPNQRLTLHYFSPLCYCFSFLSILDLKVKFEFLLWILYLV